jgi:hypothetical protein
MGNKLLLFTTFVQYAMKQTETPVIIIAACTGNMLPNKENFV